MELEDHLGATEGEGGDEDCRILCLGMATNRTDKIRARSQIPLHSHRFPLFEVKRSSDVVGFDSFERKFAVRARCRRQY
jgi:hypothetical protein